MEAVVDLLSADPEELLEERVEEFEEDGSLVARAQSFLPAPPAFSHRHSPSARRPLAATGLCNPAQQRSPAAPSKRLDAPAASNSRLWRSHIGARR